MKTQHETTITIDAGAFPGRARLETVLALAAFGGVAVAVAAALWPIEEPRAKKEIAPPPVLQSVAPVMSESDAGVIEVPETVIEAPRPELAIAHQDTETDFETNAMTLSAEGDLKGALESLRKHLHFHDPSVPTLLEIGRLSREVGEYALAEEALAQAGVLDPQNAEIEVELGRVLLTAGDEAGAAAAATRAIKLDKENASAWNLAGRVAMKRSEWERAEAAFRRAVGMEPTDPLLHNNLGLLYVYMKRGAQAVESMETSAELFGEEAPDFVSNNLGLAYEVDGRLEDARDAFEDALDTNPVYGRAQANLRRVESKIAQRDRDGRSDSAKVSREVEREKKLPLPEPSEDDAGDEDDTHDDEPAVPPPANS